MHFLNCLKTQCRALSVEFSKTFCEVDKKSNAMNCRNWGKIVANSKAMAPNSQLDQRSLPSVFCLNIEEKIRCLLPSQWRKHKLTGAGKCKCLCRCGRHPRTVGPHGEEAHTRTTPGSTSHPSKVTSSIGCCLWNWLRHPQTWSKVKTMSWKWPPRKMWRTRRTFWSEPYMVELGNPNSCFSSRPVLKQGEACLVVQGSGEGHLVICRQAHPSMWINEVNVIWKKRKGPPKN